MNPEMSHFIWVYRHTAHTKENQRQKTPRQNIEKPVSPVDDIDAPSCQCVAAEKEK